ncbi:OGRL1-like protein [Mya arenaria]|uniref:OGRL1-like protein n=1 Tax=Mya arenaria TaxID=6604 RepID=A0ABY7DXB2_MYAAR|nr:OGRL1-like protein [Mya arenaria]
MGSVIKPIRHTKSSALRAALTSEKIRKRNERQQPPRNGLSANSSSRNKMQSQVRPETRQRSSANLEFYSNKIQSRPAPGSSPSLTGEAIRNDDRLSRRVLKAYKMMLHFYGMELASELDGSVRRCAENWRHRYRHLNKSKHNYLRITRIIKALGELGLDRYQVPWVRFIIEEAIDHDELPALRGSIYYWIYAIKDPHEKPSSFMLLQGRIVLNNTADETACDWTESEADGESTGKLVTEISTAIGSGQSLDETDRRHWLGRPPQKVASFSDVVTGTVADNNGARNLRTNHAA